MVVTIRRASPKPSPNFQSIVQSTVQSRVHSPGFTLTHLNCNLSHDSILLFMGHGHVHRRLGVRYLEYHVLQWTMDPGLNYAETSVNYFIFSVYFRICSNTYALLEPVLNVPEYLYIVCLYNKKIVQFTHTREFGVLVSKTITPGENLHSNHREFSAHGL